MGNHEHKDQACAAARLLILKERWVEPSIDMLQEAKLSPAFRVEFYQRGETSVSLGETLPCALGRHPHTCACSDTLCVCKEMQMCSSTSANTCTHFLCHSGQAQGCMSLCTNRCSEVVVIAVGSLTRRSSCYNTYPPCSTTDFKYKFCPLNTSKNMQHFPYGASTLNQD